MRQGLRRTLPVVLLLHSLACHATSAQHVAEALGLEQVGSAMVDGKVATLLGPHGDALSQQDRQAAAVLIALGLIEAGQLDQERLGETLQRLQHGVTHPDYKGKIGESALLKMLQVPGQYDDLLAEQDLLRVLGEALSAGLLTGYDLRRKDAYSGFKPGHTFIYSHNSRRHLSQLATMMAAYDISARVYVVPKVSAFLYREGWGTANENTHTLPGGARVMNGREMAVMFEFDTPAARTDFHELIRRYAKKDAKDETGLIADAWWQPFYYTDQTLADFPRISLIIVSSEHHEATLTVLDEKADDIVQALSDKGFAVRVEEVWVNPAFHRFLQGGYR
jgi:hypothetical protein